MFKKSVNRSPNTNQLHVISRNKGGEGRKTKQTKTPAYFRVENTDSKYPSSLTHCEQVPSPPAPPPPILSLSVICVYHELINHTTSYEDTDPTILLLDREELSGGWRRRWVARGRGGGGEKRRQTDRDRQKRRQRV